ncbi:MAG: extracellular solute-binding protein [Nitrososphaerales archaeon]
MASRNTYIGLGVVVLIAIAGASYLYLTPAGPPPEERVSIYSTVDPEDFEVWRSAFNAKYPDIEIEYVQDRPGNIYTRIVTEMDAGQPTADVVMISLSLQLVMQDEGLLEAYRSPESAAYPDVFKDPDDYWTTVVLLPMLQVRNTDLVSDDQVPTTIDDLVDPKWNGKDTIHDLTLGTTGTQYFGSLKADMGEQQWRSFIERLASNVEPSRSRTFEGIISPVASGEFSIALAVYMHDYLSWKNRGAPIDAFTIEGLPVLTSLIPVSVVKDAEHPVAAKLFIDWVLSEEGQKVVGNTEVRIAARPGIDATYTLETVLPGRTPDDLSIFPNEDVRTNTDTYKDYFIEQFAG